MFPRPLRSLLVAALLVAAPAACRKPAQPSEAYEQAHSRFIKLFGAQGDEAFIDPEMAEVEALLAQVPEDSLDAQAAKELRARIQAGRQNLATVAAEREKALASAREQAGMPPGLANAPTVPVEPVEPAPQTPDAGTGGPAIGTPVAELSSGFSGCFQKGEQVEVRGRGPRDRWELADREACRQEYASLKDQVLIIEEGKVLALVAKSSMQAVPTDGGR